jgi:hypothetical protein
VPASTQLCQLAVTQGTKEEGTHLLVELDLTLEVLLGDTLKILVPLAVNAFEFC